MNLTQQQIEELLDENTKHKCKGFGFDKICVRIAAIDKLPSRFGDFHIFTFYNDRDSQDHAAIVHGDVSDTENVPVRMHSECLTGDVVGSLLCDCRDQLETALKQIGQMENGILLYIRQKGPDIGPNNKIRSYSLREHCYYAMETNLEQGFRDDERDCSIAAHMLFSLSVKSIQLMTNNPRLVKNLTQYRVVINGMIPFIIPPNPYNKLYFKLKTEESDHLLDFLDNLHLHEQGEQPFVDGMPSEGSEDLYPE